MNPVTKAKKCTLCGDLKLTSEFRHDMRIFRGLASRCLSCEQEQTMIAAVPRRDCEPRIITYPGGGAAMFNVALQGKALEKKMSFNPNQVR